MMFFQPALHFAGLAGVKTWPERAKRMKPLLGGFAFTQIEMLRGFGDEPSCADALDTNPNDTRHTVAIGSSDRNALGITKDINNLFYGGQGVGSSIEELCAWTAFAAGF